MSLLYWCCSFIQTFSKSYSIPKLLRKASFLEGISLSLYVWFLCDPCQRCIVCQLHVSFRTLSSLLASLTSTGLPCGNKGSNQLARFVNPHCLIRLRLWQKKLTPCIFITITSKETTNLIEYVIAQGTEVGLGSLRWASRWISSWEDNKPWAAEMMHKSHNGSYMSNCSSRVKYCFVICGVMVNKEVRVHNK